jgi:hypothetical protein
LRWSIRLRRLRTGPPVRSRFVSVLLQAAFHAVVQGLVDGLVTHLPSGFFRVLDPGHGHVPDRRRRCRCRAGACSASAPARPSTAPGPADERPADKGSAPRMPAGQLAKSPAGHERVAWSGGVPQAPDKGKLESVRVHSGEARMGPKDSLVSTVLDPHGKDRPCLRRLY